MKKLIAALLCLVMFIAAAIPSSAAATHGYRIGDVNDDGLVNVKDAVAMKRAIVNDVSRRALTYESSDLNSDGLINAKDLRILAQIIAGAVSVDGNNTDNRYKVSLVTIGGANIARYTILYPSNADTCTSYHARNTLKNAINSACGITLNVTTNRNTINGRVIEYRPDTNNEYNLGTDGYHVKVEDNGDVTLTYGLPRGSLYVTYYFLEHFIGYRYLNGGVTYTYKTDHIDTPAGYEDIEVPQFQYRALNQIGTTTTNFAPLRLNGVDAQGSGTAANARYGGGVGNLYLHGHSYAYQEAVGMKLDEAGITDLDSQAAKNIFATYGYNTSERDALNLDSTQPCLTSDNTFRHIMNFNYMLYKERSNQQPGVAYTMLSVSPNDNTSFCTCANCKAVYTREGSIAGTVFAMSNRVSDAMKETIPGVGVYTIAYWDARNPPLYTRPNDDVCVCFCIGGCNNHTYDDPDQCAAAGGNARYPFQIWDVNQQKPVTPTFNISNVYDMDCFDRWCELTNNVYVWYYACNFGYYCAPSPNVFNIYEDYKYLASKGVIGIYTEGSSRGYSFELLRGYLASRMMWDPYMTEEEFEGYLDEFLMIYYGNGWQYIKELLTIENRAGDLKGCWMNNFDWPWDMYDKTYYGQNYAHMKELLDAAYNAADTTQKKRVEMLSIHTRFLGLSATYASNWTNGTAAQRAAYKTDYVWLWTYFRDSAYMQSAREGEQYFKATSFSEGPGGVNTRPTDTADNHIVDTMNWIFEDFTGSRVN